MAALVGIVGVPSAAESIETSITRTVAVVDRSDPVPSRGDATTGAVHDDDSIVHTIVTRVTSGAVRIRTLSRWTLLATFFLLAGFAGLFASSTGPLRPAPARVPRSAPQRRRDASRAPPVS